VSVGPSILAQGTHVRVGLKALSQRSIDFLIPPKADIRSEMNDTPTGRLGDGICTPDRIELVDQSTNMELGGMDRYPKTASNRLV
jgi:hypothetical protein